MQNCAPLNPRGHRGLFYTPKKQMLKLNPTRTFQDRVDELYACIEQDTFCKLHLFEFYMRKIHVLNGKIKNLSSDYGLKEDDYNPYI